MVEGCRGGDGGFNCRAFPACLVCGHEYRQPEKAYGKEKQMPVIESQARVPCNGATQENVSWAPTASVTGRDAGGGRRQLEKAVTEFRGGKNVKTHQKESKLSSFTFFCVSLTQRGWLFGVAILGKKRYSYSKRRNILFPGDKSNAKVTFSLQQGCVSGLDGGAWGCNILVEMSVALPRRPSQRGRGLTAWPPLSW